DVITRTKEAFSWATIWATDRAARRPHRDKLAEQERLHGEWFQHELKRPGANITTEPPAAIDAAIRKLKWREANAAKAKFAKVDPTILAERARLVDDMGSHVDALLQAMPQLQAFDAEYRKRALSVGAWVERPSPIRELTDALRHYMEYQRRRSAPAPEPPRW